MKRVIISLVDGVVDEVRVPRGVELVVYDSDGDTGQGLDAITTETVYTSKSEQMPVQSWAQLAVYARVHLDKPDVGESKYVLVATETRPEIELSDVHDQALLQIEHEIELVARDMRMIGLR